MQRTPRSAPSCREASPLTQKVNKERSAEEYSHNPHWHLGRREGRPCQKIGDAHYGCTQEDREEENFLVVRAKEETADVRDHEPHKTYYPGDGDRYSREKRCDCLLYTSPSPRD